MYLPFFQASESTWANEKNQMIKVDFISRLSNFVDTLNNAQESINERILLKPCERIDLSQLQSPSEYAAIAANSESLALIEETMKTWIRQLEQVRANEELWQTSLTMFSWDAGARRE